MPLFKELDPDAPRDIKPHERNFQNREMINVTQLFEAHPNGERIGLLAMLDPTITYMWLLAEVEPAPSPTGQAQAQGQLQKQGKQELIIGIEHRNPDNPDDPALYGHPTLALKALIGGELECKDGKWLLNNKSRRFGMGNVDARKEFGVTKPKMMELVIMKFILESDFVPDRVLIRSNKTKAMKTVNVFLKKSPFPKWKPKTRDLDIKSITAPFSSEINDIRVKDDVRKNTIAELAALTEQQIDQQYRVDTLPVAGQVIVSSLGPLAHQAASGALYFQKAQQQIIKTFHKVPASLVPPNVNVVAPNTPAALNPNPASITLVLGYPPPTKFKRAVEAMDNQTGHKVRTEWKVR